MKYFQEASKNSVTTGANNQKTLITVDIFIHTFSGFLMISLITAFVQWPPSIAQNNIAISMQPTIFAHMYQIESEGKKFEVTFDDEGQATGTINGRDFAIDIVAGGDGEFNVIRGYRSYQAQVLHFDPVSKSIDIMVEGHKFSLKVKDRYDLLLEKLGLGDLNTAQAKDLVSPMPGLVLEILVKPGAKVQKGDALIILEAMKMENILKAGADGIIDECYVKQGDSAEKNEVLITFKS